MTVLEQILTGTFADGLGNVKTDAKRIDFDPFPWESFAVWILTQMKRWGQIKGDVDYAGVAQQVFLATDTAKLMKEVGLTPPASRQQDLHGDGQGRSIPPSPRSTSRASPSSARPERGRGRRQMTQKWLGLRAGLVSLALFGVDRRRLAHRHGGHRHRRRRWTPSTPS